MERTKRDLVSTRTGVSFQGIADIIAVSLTNDMGVSMKKSNFADYGKEIENQSSEYISVTGRKRRRVESIIERSRKTRNINIRISEFNLEKLRKRSEEEGIPYQTLIASLLHKYVTDQIVEEKNFLKSLKLISKKDFPISSRH